MQFSFSSIKSDFGAKIHRLNFKTNTFLGLTCAKPRGVNRSLVLENWLSKWKGLRNDIWFSNRKTGVSSPGGSPSQFEVFPGSFNLVDYDNSRDYKQTRDYGRAVALCSLATPTLIKRLKAPTEDRSPNYDREFRLLKRQSRRATGPGRVRKALMTQDRHGSVVKATSSLSCTHRTAALSGFLRDRFTLRRLTERRKPSTGRRSCFSQDFSLLMSAFSLLISPGLVTKNLPRLTERSATDAQKKRFQKSRRGEST
ncbi:hypothetical protein HAX54_022901 [Datura stramonium]|uniref:Uncharacterized protein n=1 Tax=Datura stramonium TaxID=4076 RepID=A0ABS8UX12_DATST|nr:hypothetical protein [Datura stramonium]